MPLGRVEAPDGRAQLRFDRRLLRVGLDRRDHRAAGVGQRLQEAHDGLVVAAGAIGDAHQADHVLAGIERDAEEAVERGMPCRPPAATRIGGRLVGDHRLAAGDRRAEQRFEIAELQALGRILRVEPTRLLVPGNVGDGVRLEIRLAAVVVANLSDETVGALGDVEQRGQHLLVRLFRIAVADIARLDLPNRIEQGSRTLRLFLRLDLGRDVARGPAIADELSVRAIERMSADAGVETLAVRSAIGELEIAEAAARIEDGAIAVPDWILGIDAGHLPAPQADQLRSDQASERAAAGIHGEPILCIDFPQPVGGGFGELLEPVLAFLQRAHRGRSPARLFGELRAQTSGGDARHRQQQRQRHSSNGPNHRQINVPWHHAPTRRRLDRIVECAARRCACGAALSVIWSIETLPGADVEPGAWRPMGIMPEL